MRRSRLQLGLLGALGLMLIGAAPAQAAIITDTLPEFNFDGEQPFPTAPQTIGTFSYIIPGGESIISATIAGTFGNSANDSTAPVEVSLDGLLVATCLSSQQCFNNLVAWSFTFTSSQFSLLTDGLADLTVVQTDQFRTRLGETVLTIETARVSASVPEPGTLALFGAGLAGLGLLTRRRKAA